MIFRKRHIQSYTLNVSMWTDQATYKNKKKQNKIGKYIWQSFKITLQPNHEIKLLTKSLCPLWFLELSKCRNITMLTCALIKQDAKKNKQSCSIIGLSNQQCFRSILWHHQEIKLLTRSLSPFLFFMNQDAKLWII